MVSPKLRQLAIYSVLAALILAFCVVMLGAYTRLKDAGLGCPDWPGCYGFLSVPKSEQAVAQANQAFPNAPLEQAKAWPEMIHRYAAMTLGLLIVFITILSIANRKHPGHPHKLALTLLGLLIFQALLGKWTVTMKLYPPIVMGHLLGGFAIVSVLYLLCLRLTQAMQPLRDLRAAPLKNAAAVGLGLLIIQIALGGWTSSNYAALVCAQLPICEHPWWSLLNFREAFSFYPAVDNFQYAPHLSVNAKITIQVLHRFGAMITASWLGWLGWRLLRQANTPRYRNLARLLLLILTLQISLGISNIIFQLPLFTAVAHNAVAALLLLVLITLNYGLNKKR